MFFNILILLYVCLSNSVADPYPDPGPVFLGHPDPDPLRNNRYRHIIINCIFNLSKVNFRINYYCLHKSENAVKFPFLTFQKPISKNPDPVKM